MKDFYTTTPTIILIPIMIEIIIIEDIIDGVIEDILIDMIAIIMIIISITTIITKQKYQIWYFNAKIFKKYFFLVRII